MKYSSFFGFNNFILQLIYLSGVARIFPWGYWPRGVGGGGGVLANMVNGSVPLKWVTFSQKIPKHGVWFCQKKKSVNMGCSFVILL